MGLFDTSPKKMAEYQRRYVAAVQEKLPGEEVLAVGAFYTTGSMGAAALSHASGAAAMAARAIGKKKAGGLSQNIVLAATPEHLYAFKYAPRGKSIKVKGEEAVWKRAEIEVEGEDTSVTHRITISSPSEGERVVLDTTRGPGRELAAPLLDLLGVGRP
jgi:hypothetical protein